MAHPRQKTVKFSDGRTVTFKSKEAADLARMMDKPLKRKRYTSACAQVKVCRSKKTGRFVKQKRRK